MTDQTTEILATDPVEYAGAIGHAAASQLYLLLAGAGSSSDWIGCAADGDEELAQKVYELANYVADRQAPGETLWNNAKIDAVIVVDLPESGRFADAPIGRQWAFDMFATVTLHAYLRMNAVQVEHKRSLDAAAIVAAPLKLEDSIFDPGKPLSYQEPHQQQYLADQAELERKQSALAQQAKELNAAVSVPGAIVAAETPAPATVSVGQQPGEADAKETTDQGQGASGEAEADPDAQGEISELVEDGSGDADAGEAEPGSTAGELPGDPSEQAGEVAPEVAEQPGAEGDAGGEEPVTPGKTTKAKAAN